MDSCLNEPTVTIRRSRTRSPVARHLHFLRRFLNRWREGRPCSPAEGDMNHQDAVCPVRCPTVILIEASCSIPAKQGINRITPEMRKLPEDSKMAVETIKLLDEAINLHQINCIVKAREKLHIFLRLMKHSKCMFPSKYGWEVVNRGKDIFFDENFSCSVKHGIILLDASNAGAQFHAALFSILGAFALEISEFQIAHEAYSLLIDIHGRSDATSRLRDLGAAYNNRGCISLAMGDFSQAEDDFANALTHLKWKRHKQYDSSLHSLIIAVDSNSSRLDLMSRNFVRSLKKQEKLVEVCKEKQVELPVQTIFVVMHNQAVLHTTLGNFSKAEKELRWMIEYCKTLRRDDWDFLLNFVALHLYEVLLTRGKPEEAELVLPSETLTATSVYDLIPPFEGLHFNLKIEALEKLVDVFVKSGKIKWAYDLLESGLKCIEDVYGPEHFNVALLLYKQASILKLMGDATGSMEKFEGSEGILREIFTERHPLLMKCYMSLGEVAFDLGHTNNSNIYFQRAVEHVENIFKISYPTQLSVRYTEITTASKCSSCEIVSGNQTKDPQEQKTEGLVAEYGFALAVLSSHISVQRAPRKPTTEGEQALKKKNMNLDFTESSLISQKCARDLLQSGQVLLRQGMTTEAVSFFQLASKYCQAQEVAQNISDLQLVRLYTVFSQSKLNVQNEMEINDVLKRTLEEVTLDSGINGAGEKNSEHTGLLASDCDLSLKLVLILFILLSMQLEMYDITFAAYDHYASLFSKDAKLVLSLNHGLQFYASRISITCNGKTAVQDFLLCSATGLFKDDSESHGRPLFKSLAVRKNAPTNRILVTCRTTSFLDVDGLTRLEEKVLCSFQELFQNNFLDREDSATQVFVDLTPTVSFAGKSQLTNSAIELLPICLMNDETEGENDEMHTISEKPPSVCEKITHVTFPDEPTSCLMFSRIGINLLQQCHTGRISTLRVQNQCLSLTITQPFKARIMLCREGRSVKHSLEVLSAAEVNHLSDEIAPQQSRAEYVDKSLCSRAFEKFSEAPILTWAKARQIPFETTVVLHRCSHSFGPPIVSSVVSEANEIQVNGLQTEPRLSPFFIQETEECRDLRKRIELNTLECLTAISEISQQLSTEEDSENACEEEQSRTQTDHFREPRDQHITSGPSYRDTPLSQNEELTTSSTFQPAACDSSASGERQTVLLSRCLASVRSDTNHLSHDDSAVTLEPTGDEAALGRRLFQQARKSRISFVAKIQEDLSRKETPRQVESLQCCRSSSNETPNDNIGTDQGHPLYEGHVSGSGRNSSSPEEVLQTFNGSLPRKQQQPSGACDENEAKDFLPTNEEAQIDDSTFSGGGRGGAEQISESPEIAKKTHNDVMGTVNQNVTPKDGLDVALMNKGTEAPKGRSEITCSDQYQTNSHGQRDLQYVLMASEESEDLREVKRNIFEGEAEKDFILMEQSEKHDRRKSATSEKEVFSQIESGVAGVNSLTKTLTLVSQGEDEEEPSLEGGLDKYLDTVWGYESDRRLWSCESGMEERKCKRSQDNVKQEDQQSQMIYEEKSHKSDRQKANIPYSSLDSDVVPDSDVTYGFSKEVVPATQTTPNSVLKGYRDSKGDFKTSSDGSPRLIDAGDVIDGTGSSCKVDISTDFGGARPKTNRAFRNGTKLMHPVLADQSQKKPVGLDPDFVGRHAFINDSFHSSTDYLNCNGARWNGPTLQTSEDHHFSATIFSGTYSSKVHNVFGESSLQAYHKPKRINLRSPADKDFPGESEDESWQFPPPTTAAEKYFPPSYSQVNHTCDNHESVTQRKFSCDPCPDCPDSRVALDEMPSMMKEFKSKSIEYGNGVVRSTTNSPPRSLESYEGHTCDNHESVTQRKFSCDPCPDCPDSRVALDEMLSMMKEFKSKSIEYGNGAVRSTTNSPPSSVESYEDPGNSYEDHTMSLLEQLKGAMARTVRIVKNCTSTGDVERQFDPAQNPDKIGIQEQSQGDGENQHSETERDTNASEGEAHRQQTEQTEDTVPRAPIQETPRAVCKHYQRRCLVKFPCCGNFYPCHRCHNESQECSEDQARAISATHIRCTICYHEQVIDEASQTCQGCNSKMSAFFCPICKHFTSVEKNPFHCEKCGICRIHKDKSFHCDVCNVCLDKRLQGKHKCRPDSGHDECCICLEDAFSGCQILPCSHKVHKDCAIAMIQNGVRKCPICRHPLFQQRNNTNQ